ncbi:MAG: chemotaxis protein CheA [Myxococcales bacterium]|nr:chemotaxis protein CheA [Myxococcales bacterium]
MSPPAKGLSEFVAEANEILDLLGRDLLVLDEQRRSELDPDLVNRIFRGAHSLKGLSGMFGQDAMADLAHAAEEVLDRLRLGKIEPSAPVVDSLVEALDALQALLSEASREGHEGRSAERAKLLANRLSSLASFGPPPSSDELDEIGLPAQIRAVFTEYEEHRLKENVRKGVPLWRVRAAFDLTDFDVGLAKVNDALKPLGEVISTLPSAEPGAGSGIAFDLIFGSKSAAERIHQALIELPAKLAPLSGQPAPAPSPVAEEKAAAEPARKPATTKRHRVSVRPRRPTEAPPPARVELPRLHAEEGPTPTERREPDLSLRSLTQTVRVDIRRLDSLMNAVGELLLIRANVQRLAESALAAGAHAVSKLWGQELSRECRALERKLDELQTGILDARMVPLGQVFDKLARLVRRLAREAGKELDFAVSGGEVELDKLIVEELSDPLMHIIRNAIDHGVELPDERAEHGKPRRGTVSLRAEQRGNHVVIEVSDDGSGLDESRIRQVAVQRGLVVADQAQEMNRRELQNLIFLPGFSTARSVSAISGRGVGLDVVKTNIANLSGIIDVSSEAGRGTTLTLTLPVTLAIIRALMVSVSDRTYAVPLNSVLEIVSVEGSEIRTVERREVFSLRGRTLPFMRLARLFALPERPLSRHFVVVVGLAQERLGLAVDELIGQQDIVIKPLGGKLRHIPGIAGATDLGNRRTVLVLDIGALMEEVISPERRAEFI